MRALSLFFCGRHMPLALLGIEEGAVQAVESVSDMNVVSLAGTRRTREAAGRTSWVGHLDITPILRRGPDPRQPGAVDTAAVERAGLRDSLGRVT